MADAAPDGLSLFDLFDPAHKANPYPVYQRLREIKPIWQAQDGLFVLTRHEDCSAVLRHSRFGHGDPEDVDSLRFRPRVADDRPVGERHIAESFLRRNPPDHTRLRQLVSRAFTPRTVENLTPRIEEITAELVTAALAIPGPFDLVETLASPLPVAVIGELLGIPVADRAQLVDWSHALARGLDPDFVLPEGARETQGVARAELAAYLYQLAATRRRRPGDDLLSALVAVRDRDDVLSEDELVTTCLLLLIAGHETTTNLIGNGMLALLRHRDQLARLRADPAMVAPAVEELLRYDSPVQLTARTALERAEVGGVPLARGSFVLLLIGAANRDPEFHDDPNRFDVGRVPSRHLAFGQGIHFCLGAPLARLEAQIALRALSAIGTMRLTGEPTWKEATVLRGVASLPVSIAPDTGPVPP